MANRLDNLKKGKKFKKGDSRINRNGRPPKLPQLDVLLDKVLGAEQNGITAAEAILAALRKKAALGDVRAAEVLMDRAYGKAKQTVAHEGELALLPASVPLGMRVHRVEEPKPKRKSKPRKKK